MPTASSAPPALPPPTHEFSTLPWIANSSTCQTQCAPNTKGSILGSPVTWMDGTTVRESRGSLAHALSGNCRSVHFSFVTHVARVRHITVSCLSPPAPGNFPHLTFIFHPPRPTMILWPWLH